MINLFKNLNPIAFIVSFLLGMIYCYYMKPPKRIMYKHPTPNNINNTIYRNNHDQCYKYTMEEVNCPENEKAISEIPVQIS